MTKLIQEGQVDTRWTIRQASESDAEEISALVTSLSRYFLSDPQSPEVGPFLETLTPAATAERITSDEFDCCVAEHDNEICGVVALRNNSHLYHLFVRSDVHRKGVARALWHHVRALSNAEVFTVNSSLFAVPVYEKFGFRAVDQLQTVNGLTFVPMEFSNDR